MVHGVAPTRAGQVTEMRAAQGRDAALGFHLAEPAVVGGNDDSPASISSMPIVKRSLHGRDDRLATALAEPEQSHSFLDVALLGVRAEELRHVQARGEVACLGADDADPLAIVVVQLGQRVRQLLHHLGTKAFFLAGLSMTIFRMRSCVSVRIVPSVLMATFLRST